MAIRCCGLRSSGVNALHDSLQLGIYLLKRPGKVFGVLGHLKTGNSYATCVCSLARCEKDAVFDEIIGCLEGGWHISALNDVLGAVRNKFLHVSKLELVLSCAWHSDVTLLTPRTLTWEESSRRTCVGVLLDACATNLLDVFQQLNVNTLRVINIT